MSKKNIVIIGAGPAGLTAAYELLSRDTDKEYNVIVIDKDDKVGGISKTVNCAGNKMDLGGHRFFSKVDRVNEWWEHMMPTQGSPSKDYKQLGIKCELKEGGPNPDEVDKVMLRRNRVSRILYNGHFFDYPISLSFKTIKEMGVSTTAKVGLSYIKAVTHKIEEKSLEDFYINRFGYELYSMFFMDYTEKIWGVHPCSISPDWGAQRVKGLSIKAIMQNMLRKAVHSTKGNIETSLIEVFSYPKYGPGQLWEETANKINELGGEIKLKTEVKNIHIEDGKIQSIRVCKDRKDYDIQCDILLSSMPLKELIKGINGVPKQIFDIAEDLQYRNFVTVGLLLKRLKITNNTKIKTINNIIPDDWIYIHGKTDDSTLQMSRVQIFNNWSPYLVKDLDNTIWISTEYVCGDNDKIWNSMDYDLQILALKELNKAGIIDDDFHNNLINYTVKRVDKAYPSYFGSYDRLPELREYLNSIDNLYCIGRNGQHRYNNMDHSMCTAFEAVDNIFNGVKTKDNIWNVNTEAEYHETK